MQQSIERITAVLEIIAHQTGIGNRLKDSLVDAKMKEIADREEKINPKPSEEDLEKQAKEAQRIEEEAKKKGTTRSKVIEEILFMYFYKEDQEEGI